MASLTGIFDDIYVKQLFQKNERGETVFYPFGLIGRGYLLPKDREADLRRATRLLTLASLIVSISLGLLAARVSGSTHSLPLSGWLALGVIFAAILAVTIYLEFRLAAGLESAGERIAAGEWLRRGRRARAAWTYWGSVVAGIFFLLFAIAGVALGIADRDGSALIGAAFFLLLGGFATWDGSCGLIERQKRVKDV
jgi:hypothetical protein